MRDVEAIKPLLRLVKDTGFKASDCCSSFDGRNQVVDVLEALVLLAEDANKHEATEAEYQEELSGAIDEIEQMYRPAIRDKRPRRIRLELRRGETEDQHVLVTGQTSRVRGTAISEARCSRNTAIEQERLSNSI